MYKNFEDIVKKDNPKLNQGSQLKFKIIDSNHSFDTNNVIDYTKKSRYFGFIKSFKQKDLDKSNSINNLYTGINIIKVDLKNYKKNQTFKFNINFRYIQKLNTTGLDSYIKSMVDDGLVHLLSIKDGKIDSPINLKTDGIIYLNNMESLSYQPINIKTPNESVFLVMANCKGTFNFNFSKTDKCPPEKFALL